MRAGGVLIVLLLTAAVACTGADEQAEPAGTTEPTEPSSSAAGSDSAFPAAPEVGSGDLDPEVEEAVAELVRYGFRQEAVDTVVAGGDARVAWLLSDLLRFELQGAQAGQGLVAAFEELTGASLADDARSAWGGVTDLLIAWDLPAWPGYEAAKASIFLRVEPAWEPFFADAASDLDWRIVSWGGVRIDDRPLGDPNPCPHGCIPSLDDPTLTPASEGDWYDDDRIVFGVDLDGEAVAFPRHQMEIHEMVNITIADRRLGIPYCTLCGAAQAYFTDTLPEEFEPAVLRTSGLLSRSNKVMYDLNTQSVFDTFTGRAVSGPLREADVTLEQTTVVASTWGAWKAEHPHTLIVAEDGGIGRSYPDDPLRGRDDDGPIFPIGSVDPRLPVQEPVVGVIAPDGTPIAFPVEQARGVLDDGGTVAVGDLTAHLVGDGLRVTVDDEELPAHQAFWFAWSQFHPDTEVWTPLAD